MPALLPSLRWALTPPFHPNPSKLRRFVFCGTFPEVTFAGRYPAPYSRGARTFLPRTLAGLARAAIQPTGSVGLGPQSSGVNKNHL